MGVKLATCVAKHLHQPKLSDERPKSNGRAAFELKDSVCNLARDGILSGPLYEDSDKFLATVLRRRAGIGRGKCIVRLICQSTCKSRPTRLQTRHVFPLTEMDRDATSVGITMLKPFKPPSLVKNQRELSGSRMPAEPPAKRQKLNNEELSSEVSNQVRSAASTSPVLPRKPLLTVKNPAEDSKASQTQTKGNVSYYKVLWCDRPIFQVLNFDS